MVSTLNDVYLDLRRELRAAGISSVDTEARELICLAAGIDRHDFFAKRSEFLFDDHIDRLRELVERRLSGVPLQYILGRWEFYGLEFKVDENTLIPRADTETLVDAAADYLKDKDKARVLDLCCGTGCIGIAVTRITRGRTTCLLADISEGALKVARENVEINGMVGSVSVAECDVMIPCPTVFGLFDVITCNPPYIPSEDMDKLDIEVRNEPRIALDGGRDGLDYYRHVCQNFRRALKVGGALMFEVGLGQYEDVSEIMKSFGFENIQVFKDLSRIERVVTGILPKSAAEEDGNEKDRTDVANLTL